MTEKHIEEQPKEVGNINNLFYLLGAVFGGLTGGVIQETLVGTLIGAVIGLLFGAFFVKVLLNARAHDR